MTRLEVMTTLPVTSPPAQARAFEYVVSQGKYQYRRLVGTTGPGHGTQNAAMRTIVLTAEGRFTAFRQKYGVEP